LTRLTLNPFVEAHPRASQASEWAAAMTKSRLYPSCALGGLSLRSGPGTTPAQMCSTTSSGIRQTRWTALSSLVRTSIYPLILRVSDWLEHCARFSLSSYQSPRVTPNPDQINFDRTPSGRQSYGSFTPVLRSVVPRMYFWKT